MIKVGFRRGQLGRMLLQGRRHYPVETLVRGRTLPTARPPTPATHSSQVTHTCLGRCFVQNLGRSITGNRNGQRQTPCKTEWKGSVPAQPPRSHAIKFPAAKTSTKTAYRTLPSRATPPMSAAAQTGKMRHATTRASSKPCEEIVAWASTLAVPEQKIGISQETSIIAVWISKAIPPSIPGWTWVFGIQNWQSSLAINHARPICPQKVFRKVDAIASNSQQRGHFSSLLSSSLSLSSPPPLSLSLSLALRSRALSSLFAVRKPFAYQERTGMCE